MKTTIFDFEENRSRNLLGSDGMKVDEKEKREKTKNGRERKIEGSKEEGKKRREQRPSTAIGLRQYSKMYFT